MWLPVDEDFSYTSLNISAHEIITEATIDLKSTEL